MEERKWHYTSENDYPVLDDVEQKQVYPQRFVLTFRRGWGISILCWNFTEECWDGADGDDYECDKEDVYAWMELPEAPKFDK